MNPTVFIVDDDASFRTAAARLLQASGLTVQAFSSAQAFLAALKPEASGCVVADLEMPEMNGLELQAALERTRNQLPVVFLTGKGDIASTVHAIRGGAEDFLEKRAPKEKLLNAIHRALARDGRERELRAKKQAAQARFEKLSEREFEVLAYVLQGALNKQIADELGICERTVKFHRTSIKTKVGVQSVAELVHLARAAGTCPKGQ